MDKLMDNRWFMKIIALLLAFLLYSSVPQSEGKKLNEIYVPGDETTETIKDVPVNTYYDTENLIVSGIPKTVDLKVSGPKSHVRNAVTLRNFEVYVDLTDAEVGSRNVKLKIRDLSDKLSAAITPSSLTVSIQEKITKEFRVEAEFNSSLVDDGFGASNPRVNPDKVKITGAKEVIDKITYVKATVDIKGRINETTTRDAKIRVLDRELNKLEVIVEPDTVEVTIPIKSLTKKVPINIVEKGALPDGLAIESIEPEAREAIITAEEDVLKTTEAVRVEIDLSTIKESGTVIVPVIISEGVVAVSPEQIKINVKVKKVEDEKSLSALPVSIDGLSDNQKAVFKDPESGTINLMVYGTEDQLKSIGPDDFKLFVDAKGLQEGEHDIRVQVNGPKEVTWKVARPTATVSIANTDV